MGWRCWTLGPCKYCTQTRTLIDFYIAGNFRRNLQVFYSPMTAKPLWYQINSAMYSGIPSHGRLYPFEFVLISIWSSYPFHPTPLPEKQKRERDSLTSHENPSGGQLILGHASLLTSVLLTLDEKYIITSDRDEHIRVSWWPQGYTIEMYCMGHKKYVTRIHISLSFLWPCV